MHFHTLFHPHVFPQIFSNNNFSIFKHMYQTGPYLPKQCSFGLFFFNFLIKKKLKTLITKKEKKKKKLRGTTSFPANWKESFFFFYCDLKRILNYPNVILWELRMQNKHTKLIKFNQNPLQNLPRRTIKMLSLIIPWLWSLASWAYQHPTKSKKR